MLDLHQEEVRIRQAIAGQKQQALPETLHRSLAEIPTGSNTQSNNTNSRKNKRILSLPILSAVVSVAAAIVLMLNIGLLMDSNSQAQAQAQSSAQMLSDKIDSPTATAAPADLGIRKEQKLSEDIAYHPHTPHFEIMSDDMDVVVHETEIDHVAQKTKSKMDMRAKNTQELKERKLKKEGANLGAATAGELIASVDEVTDISTADAKMSVKKNMQRDLHAQSLTAQQPLRQAAKFGRIESEESEQEKRSDKMVSEPVQLAEQQKPASLRSAQSMSTEDVAAMPGEKSTLSRNKSDRDKRYEVEVESDEIESDADFADALSEARKNIAENSKIHDKQQKQQQEQQKAGKKDQVAVARELVRNMNEKDKEKNDKLDEKFSVKDAPPLKLVLAAQYEDEHFVLAIQMDHIPHQWFSRAILDYRLQALDKAGHIIWTSKIVPHTINEDITELRSNGLPPAHSQSIQLHSLGQKSNLIELINIPRGK
ncbi:MAG: hypothetical protein HRU15_16325 [Planctomycetes bacterium]|nr:hypothetical protein [Planctomycetota bacterium]